MYRFVSWCLVAGGLALATVPATAQAGDWLDLRGATVVIAGEQELVEATATQVLIEETARRTGETWKTANALPDAGPFIELGVAPGLKPEGFHIGAGVNQGRPVVRIIGADGSGALYGVGKFLRLLEWAPGKALFPVGTNIVTAPEYALRGHQLGYRNLANSYDAWTPAQYEQFIRELSFFGINAIENIPMSERAPLMPVAPEEMHRAMADICKRYGMQYWLFMPVLIELEDEAARERLLDEFEAVFRGCDHLSGVMIPGGDPGDHDVTLFSFAEEAAARLHAVHPEAGMWVSLQRFRGEDLEDAYAFLNTEPEWLAGITAGPSAPPLPEMRERIPARYPIRRYTDVTHNKISQYPVPWWDQAYARTLGREAINPRPVEYAQIHNWFAPYSAGFVAYSDGIHDDVNKIVWAALGWDSTRDVRDILREYGRVYFAPEAAEAAADGLLALERNWRGPLRYNASVEGTLSMWEALDAQAPALRDNWRWRMNLVRADYDAFVRRRLLHEEALEEEANRIMLEAPERGADAAMDAALAVLAKAESNPGTSALRERIVAACEALNKAIGLQTSVETYGAMNPERGAILDLMDVPLNNRWWIEDEFSKIRGLDSEAAKVAALTAIATWERPVPGARYDAVGLSDKAPHVKRAEEVATIHGEEALPAPLHWWIDNGKSRLRLSWQTSVDYPEAVVYEGLDPEHAYTVRVTGYGQQLLRIDGERVSASVTGSDYGAFNEFTVPASALADRRIELTWDRPTDEGHLNWRQRSRLCEVWLLPAGEAAR